MTRAHWLERCVCAFAIGGGQPRLPGRGSLGSVLAWEECSGGGRDGLASCVCGRNVEQHGDKRGRERCGSSLGDPGAVRSKEQHRSREHRGDRGVEMRRRTNGALWYDGPAAHGREPKGSARNRACNISSGLQLDPTMYRVTDGSGACVSLSARRSRHPFALRGASSQGLCRRTADGRASRLRRPHAATRAHLAAHRRHPAPLPRCQRGRECSTLASAVASAALASTERTTLAAAEPTAAVATSITAITAISTAAAVTTRAAATVTAPGPPTVAAAALATTAATTLTAVPPAAATSDATATAAITIAPTALPAALAAALAATSLATATFTTPSLTAASECAIPATAATVAITVATPTIATTVATSLATSSSSSCTPATQSGLLRGLHIPLQPAD